MSTFVKSLAKKYNKMVKSVKNEIADAKELLTPVAKPVIKEVVVKTVSVRKTTAKKLANMSKKIDGGYLTKADEDLARAQSALTDAQKVYRCAKEEADLVIRGMEDAKRKVDSASLALTNARKLRDEIEESTSIRRGVASSIKSIANFIK